MVLFQPPAGPPNPFSLGEYRSHETLLWITIIIGAVWAFFLLVEYLNTRKLHHLFWAFSFIAAYIVFHQIALIGTYGDLFANVSSALYSIITGSIAVGLLYVLYPDKKLWKLSYGQLYMLFVLIMAMLIGIYGLPNIQMYPLGLDALSRKWVPRLIETIAHLPSILIIIIIPAYTTLKTKKTGKPALLMSVGGLLFGINGLLLMLMRMEISDPFITIGLFPFWLIFGIGFFAFGMLYEKTWRFEIPGVEFED
ncbi:hypothetical protein LCGC14_2118700 [marine sediment metagenome]|uniref:Histidine kinase N-terminal 7TM region domain-containing protein n=1 Tax=marine sediment metagenome TaxID=412755 RepID=A0A0F9E4X2_9ZZZZ